eukprot:TRINITY_DN9660_c0_g2_i3.p1 TRINITY_DN9660_c0_g2~~TRINITY_DN9660_c0_g2_i3.p1  ORF type:complete len:418 (+),score=53.14 TRINITY_DN9660_c0_g2_i3:124-1377(+)
MKSKIKPIGAGLAFNMRCLLAVMVVLGELKALAFGTDSSRWSKIMLKNESITHGAKCLDGSVPGYYLRQGQGANASKLLIHFLGGGWCWDLASCAERSRSDIGSSVNWTSTIPTKFYHNGIMADNDPDFGTWALAYVMYCDGSSYTSNRSTTAVFNNTILHFRGRSNLAALLYHWTTTMTLDTVVVSGSSAGGLTVYLHLDTIAQAFKSQSTETRIVGMVDAGYFLNHSNTAGVNVFGKQAYAAMPIWGVTAASFDHSCVTANDNDYAACFFAEVAFRYLETPVFVTNSMIDAWQLENVLQVGCHSLASGGCSARQRLAIEQWQLDFVSSMEQVFARARDKPSQCGVFLDACYIHTETCGDSWHAYTAYTMIGNATMAQAFHEWFFGTQSSIYVDQSSLPWSPMPNPTCQASAGGWC